MSINYRLVNKLWMEPVETLTKDDLKLLEEAFNIGLLPLGDFYNDNNPIWAQWKKDVKERIKSLEDENKLLKDYIENLYMTEIKKLNEVNERYKKALCEIIKTEKQLEVFTVSDIAEKALR